MLLSREEHSGLSLSKTSIFSFFHYKSLPFQTLVHAVLAAVSNYGDNSVWDDDYGMDLCGTEQFTKHIHVHYTEKWARQEVVVTQCYLKSLASHCLFEFVSSLLYHLTMK